MLFPKHRDKVGPFCDASQILTINDHDHNPAILVDFENFPVSIQGVALPRVSHSRKDDPKLRLHRIENAAKLRNVRERRFVFCLILALADKIPTQFGTKITYRSFD